VPGHAQQTANRPDGQRLIAIASKPDKGSALSSGLSAPHKRWFDTCPSFRFHDFASEALPADTPPQFLDTYTHGILLVNDERELWVTSCPGNARYVLLASPAEAD